MKTIGLIASGKIEAFAFLKFISEKKKLKLGQFDVYYFKLNGYEIFLVLTNKNMVNARLATAMLIEKISPLLIVTFGIAGAINDELRVNDIVCGNATTMLENGVFEQYIGMSTIPADIRKFILNLLIEDRERIFLGTIITVNGKQAIRDFSKIHFNHPVFDMETLGVAQAATRKKVPVFSLRGITHNIAHEGEINLHTLFDYTWNFNKKAVVSKLLAHPWKLLRFFNFYKTKIRVANHVANTLFSLLHIISLDKYNDYEDFYYRI